MNKQSVDILEKCLDELGTAYRNDWFDFDGRLLDVQLGAVSDMMKRKLTHNDLVAFRENNLLCPHGQKHWTSWCNEFCLEEQMNLDK